MNVRLKVSDICILTMLAHDRVEKLRPLAKGKDLHAILCDGSLRWVRSKKCPKSHVPAFAEAVGFIQGAARALGVSAYEFATQLLDEDENQEAMVLGTVAQYSMAFRRTQGE